MKFFIEIISTLFFVGYLPAAGTFAALFSFPLVIFLSKLNLFFQLIFLIIYFFLSVMFSSLAEQKIFLIKDDNRIVIDESFGFLVAMFAIDISNVYNLLLGFLIFRILDITKIFTKKLQNLPSGWGIVGDDFGSGLITNLILRIIYVSNL